ncbi:MULTISPECIES: dTDP-4-dehydrorhamnose reductase [Cobetia]|uniref:dTDP-4-dehydrorhamnose reductase n=1 Tax=Cobetia TaxID=204286 RepID=UPI00098789D0|nr:MULTISPECIES: dTDP-4-dehydrorhamnose reductase [Cobetia]POR07015.1 dTDP-4-dehydrorhamnose reductase [Cobetia sp. MM1IDA2H-1]
MTTSTCFGRILILGGNGQVGFELQRSFAPFGEVRAPRRSDVDASDLDAVATLIDAYQPQLILNAAAWTAVDKAEEEREGAMRLNAELPALLAEKASALGVTLVHYSSDYVYPGDGDQPWREDSPTAPLSVYGESKLVGDEAVLASGCRHLVFRTSWVYAARGNNFMKTMLKLGRDRDALNIVNDQIGAPTPARLIAQLTCEALRKRIDSGLYHLAPQGTTSWHGFAQSILRLAIEQGEALAVDPQTLGGIPTAEYPTPATRPLNSRLALTKLEAALGLDLPDWQSQLALTLREHLDR